MVYISVVAPMLNEEDIVDIFLTEVGKELEKIDLKYEIIVVDDGSIDKTPIKLTTKALLDDRIIAI
jgi:glycosyltransferase involved in cell wall biosynthesis